MKKIEKENIQKILFVVGITIFVIGLIVNSLPPSKLKRMSDLEGFNLVQDEFKAISLTPEVENIEYQFTIYFHAELSELSNCSIVLLLDSEYEKFLTEGTIDNVIVLHAIENQYEVYSEDVVGYIITCSTDAHERIHLLFINFGNSARVFNYGYYYSISTPTLFLGVILMIIGALITFSVGSWYLIGWKRYFCICVGISSCFFLVRVAILPLSLAETFATTSIFDVFHPEIYRDFETYYIGWSDLFTSGIFPYSSQYFYYAYGPLFVITTGIFAFLPIPFWSVAIPIFLSTIATGYLVYLISRKLTNNEKYSIYSMIIYFLNPFTLMYSSFGWLNTSLFMFFIVLSFYLVLENKNELSVVSLGVSVMFKQFALIFFPLLLLLVIKNKNRIDIKNKVKDFCLYALIFCFTVLIISLPFLIVNFESYIRGYINNTVFSIEFLTTFAGNIGRPVNFNMFFILIGCPNILILGMGYLILYYILFGGSLVIIYGYYLRYHPSRDNAKKDGNNSLIIEAIILSIFLVITLQLFYPRGSFKYYLVLLVPFISILFNYEDLTLQKIRSIEAKDFNFKKRFFLPLIISWIVFFCYRYVYFWILIVWVLFYIYARFSDRY
ncbi:MAG: DolP-mannose mannosyltransferase, partial [Candidatus Lokiarchaeota archaeon]|nr:DolP-mannose mannosyltransferase [Candidatus Lokiarchaeota archaeon]